jgi:hypothetical protein
VVLVGSAARKTAISARFAAWCLVTAAKTGSTSAVRLVVVPTATAAAADGAAARIRRRVVVVAVAWTMMSFLGSG